MLPHSYFRRSISIITLFFFVASFIGPSPVSAQLSTGMMALPIPGTMITTTQPYVPLTLKGLVIHPENAFKYDFIMDTGNSHFDQQGLNNEALKIMKYFLTALTVPEEDLWVNLSPYEKGRVIESNFGQTMMGRDLLAQDYVLKQLTASLIYPENQLGQKFWSEVYKKAMQQYGTTQIPVNTFNKVWIVPSEAVVWEHDGKAMIVKSHLKVMLEEDYLSLQKHNVETPFMASPSSIPSLSSKPSLRDAINRVSTQTIAAQIVRTLVLPVLEKEVNEGEHFAQLRQMYQAMILATWYKESLKNSILNKVYSNKKKIAGLFIKKGFGNDIDAMNINTIYQRYLSAFKKGAFNYIKEEIDPVTNQTIPRKYFSGGFSLDQSMTTKGIKKFALTTLVVLKVAAASLLPAYAQEATQATNAIQVSVSLGGANASNLVSAKQLLLRIQNNQIDPEIREADVNTLMKEYNPNLRNDLIKIMKDSKISEIVRVAIITGFLKNNIDIENDLMDALPRETQEANVRAAMIEGLRVHGKNKEKIITLFLKEFNSDINYMKDDSFFKTKIRSYLKADRNEVPFDIFLIVKSVTEELYPSIKNNDKNFDYYNSIISSFTFALENGKPLIKAIVAQYLNELGWDPELNGSTEQKIMFYLAYDKTNSLKNLRKIPVTKEVEKILLDNWNNMTVPQKNIVKIYIGPENNKFWETVGITVGIAAAALSVGYIGVKRISNPTERTKIKRIKAIVNRLKYKLGSNLYQDRQQLFEFLNDVNPKVRFEAIKGLGELDFLEYKNIEKKLQEMLKVEKFTDINAAINDTLLSGAKIVIAQRIDKIQDIKDKITNPSLSKIIKHQINDLNRRKLEDLRSHSDEIKLALNLVGQVYLTKKINGDSAWFPSLNILTQDPNLEVKQRARQLIQFLSDKHRQIETNSWGNNRINPDDHHHDDDNAMLQTKTNGGINLNSSLMNLRVNHDQGTEKLFLNQKTLGNMNFEGLVPNIISIKSLDLKSFLGIN